MADSKNAQQDQQEQPSATSKLGRYKWLVFLLPLLFLGYIILDNAILG